MKQSKWISIITLLALLFTAGCSNGVDYSNTTLTGEITALDGTTVTLQLGELSEQSADSQPPAKPGDDQQPSGQAMTDDGQPPVVPDDGGQPSDKAMTGDGQPPSGGKPSGGAPSGMVSFTAGEETATLDVSGAVVQVESMGKTEETSLDDLAEGDVVVIEVGAGNAVDSVTVKQVMGNGGGFGGGSGEVTNGTAANTIDADGTYTDETYTSTGDDENALRVDGATVSLDGIAVEKTAGATSNTENGDFYGQNAGLLALNGAQVTIQNATVHTTAQNGNGVFSYGDGTVVNISDSTITTTADNSGGIQTTGGGTTNASNLTIETEGSSSAAIRSDRGGGTVNVDGGSYTSNGYNSPAVYSTAVVNVKHATLTATNSEALVIEGQNSITLEDCDVTGNMSDTKGTSSDENVHNVMIYQSMSGDAEVGTSEFSMTGGTLTSQNGDLIYITNTHCLLTLSNVLVNNLETDGYLLRVTGNSASRGWGTAGANGAQAEVTLLNQTLEGDIVVDTISTLQLTIGDGSSLTGTIQVIDNAEHGAAVADNAVVTVEAGATWTLTGDCTLTSLDNQGTIVYNGYTITLADGTVLNG